MEYEEGENCPECEYGVLLVRENSQDGTKFLGCDEYPRCNFTEDIEEGFERRDEGTDG